MHPAKEDEEDFNILAPRSKANLTENDDIDPLNDKNLIMRVRFPSLPTNASVYLSPSFLMPLFLSFPPISPITKSLKELTDPGISISVVIYQKNLLFWIFFALIPPLFFYCSSSLFHRLSFS